MFVFEMNNNCYCYFIRKILRFLSSRVIYRNFSLTLSKGSLSNLKRETLEKVLESTEWLRVWGWQGGVVGWNSISGTILAPKWVEWRAKWTRQIGWARRQRDYAAWLKVKSSSRFYVMVASVCTDFCDAAWSQVIISQNYPQATRWSLATQR